MTNSINNPNKFATNDAPTSSPFNPSGLTDDIDFPHTGLFKALNLGVQGNYVISGFNISSATASTFTVAAGKVMRDGLLIDVNTANLTLSTSYTNGYHLLVAPTGSSPVTAVLRNPTAANKVPEYVAGDTIIAIVVYVGTTGPLQVQYLTNNKTENSLSLGYDNSGYTETGTLTADANGITMTGLYKLDTLPTATVDSANSKIIIQDGDNSDEIRTITAGNVGDLGKQDLQGVTDEGAVTSNGIQAASFTGGSFIKTGGTSAQFLKADGSVDSNTYITGYTETQNLQDVTDIDATTTNSITTGGLSNNGKQIFDIREVNATNFGVGFPIEYRSYYINEPSGGIVMEAGTEGQIINIKNINSVPLVLNFSSNLIEQSNLSNDHRLTPSNIVTLQQWEGITLQYVNDGVTGPPSWYIVDTDETGGGGDVVDDTSPQLGNDLDVNGYKIISASNGDVEIEPNGTGEIVLDGDVVVMDAHTFTAPTLGNVSSSSATYNLSKVTNAGKYLIYSGTGTVNLPLISTVGEQYTVLNVSSGDITIGANTNNINGSGSDVTVGTYNGVTCIAIGSNNWIVLGV
jgi:hypothetical protein